MSKSISSFVAWTIYGVLLPAALSGCSSDDEKEVARKRRRSNSSSEPSATSDPTPSAMPAPTPAAAFARKPVPTPTATAAVTPYATSFAPMPAATDLIYTPATPLGTPRIPPHLMHATPQATPVGTPFAPKPRSTPVATPLASFPMPTPPPMPRGTAVVGGNSGYQESTVKISDLIAAKAAGTVSAPPTEFAIDDYQFDWIVARENSERSLSLRRTPAGVAVFISWRGYPSLITLDEADAIGTVLLKADEYWQKMKHSPTSTEETVYSNERCSVKYVWNPDTTVFGARVSVPGAGGIHSRNDTLYMHPEAAKIYGRQLRHLKVLAPAFHHKLSAVFPNPAVAAAPAAASEGITLDDYSFRWNLVNEESRPLYIQKNPTRIALYLEAFTVPVDEAEELGFALQLADDYAKKMGAGGVAAVERLVAEKTCHVQYRYDPIGKQTFTIFLNFMYNGGGGGIGFSRESAKLFGKQLQDVPRMLAFLDRKLEPLQLGKKSPPVPDRFGRVPPTPMHFTFPDAPTAIPQPSASRPPSPSSTRHMSMPSATASPATTTRPAASPTRP